MVSRVNTLAEPGGADKRPLRVVVDAETTGLDPRRDAIVQAGFAYVDPATGTRRAWSEVCNPGAAFLARGVESGAFRVNGRTAAELARAKISTDVARDFAAAIRAAAADIQIFAFNREFDQAFLSRPPWNVPFRWGPCIMKLAHRRLGPAAKWPTLREACARFGVAYEARKAHDAGYDAEAALALLERLAPQGKAMPARGVPQGRVE